MRAILLIALFPLLIAGCADLGFIKSNPDLAGGPYGTIPPQRGGEPRTILLSEMRQKLGWEQVEAKTGYDRIIRSPEGDTLCFRENSEVVTANGSPWRMERDAVCKRGNDLLLPESVFDWAAKRYGRSDLTRGAKPKNAYELEPLTPSKGPEKATGTELKGWTICIDAGHGGKDPGAIAHGVTEKDVTLAVSLRLQKLCEAAGAKVIMTRTDDSYPELDSRCALANDSRADLFISVHANIAPNSDEVTGCEAFYNENSESSRRLSAALVSAIVKGTGVLDRGAKKDPRGLRVLTKTRMTATLVELGFLSNRGEALKLGTKECQEKMAKALFAGLVKFAAGERKPVVSK